ncbi:MAG: PD-(D/E)XK nuclease family protein, partial [Alphaproteobacteria bacterium]
PKGCWYELITDALDIDLDSDKHPLYRLDNAQDAEVESEDAGQKRAARVEDGLPDWAVSPPAPEPEPSRPLTPSRPADDPTPVVSPFNNDDGLRFRRGTIIHRLLESVPDIAETDRAEAIGNWLARPTHDLSAAEQADIAAETLAVLENPDFAPLFGPGSLAEVPLCGVIDGRVVSGRIDRLLVTDDEIRIIDYKTNRPPPDSVDGVAPDYLSQMATYRQLLADVYPGRKITCILAWTHGARLMVLPDALLAP